ERTGQDAHQCRLAGAVFTDDAVHTALADGEADIVQRIDTGKALMDAAHFENCVLHHINLQVKKSFSRLIQKRLQTVHLHAAADVVDIPSAERHATDGQRCHAASDILRLPPSSD